MHDARKRRHGDPLTAKVHHDWTFEERFWAKVDKGGDSDCWLWTAYRTPAGYGQVVQTEPKRKVVYAHRASYELAFGPIPAGLTIDHLCRNTSCVNPTHMEAVPLVVNLMRGTSIPAKRARQTACQRGHPFDEANTVYNSKGHRLCRTCWP